jgi:phospholipase D1/2
MGWSDISISLSGPIVQSLIYHFTDRWNYIFKQKYVVRTENKYAPLESARSHTQQSGDLFRDVHQRLHHGMRQMMGTGQYDGDGPSDQSNGEANIQLTRR